MINKAPHYNTVNNTNHLNTQCNFLQICLHCTQNNYFGVNMKKLILILIGLASFSLMAANHTCQDQVQDQVNEVTAFDYSIEIEDLTSNQSSFNAEIYDSGISFSLSDENIKTFSADSSAMGCYGTEYIVFDETSCIVLAIGNGYCD